MNDRTIFYYKKSMSALEFDKVKETLASFAAIHKTQEMIGQIVPLYDRGCVVRMQREVTQAKNMLSLNRRVPLGNLSDDIDLNISRAVKGITLNVNDFMAISRLMRMSVRMYDYRKDSNAQTDTLEILFERMFTDKALPEKIDRIFPDGEHVADDASPALLSIRRSIIRESQKIKESLDKYIRSADVSPYLQDSLVTIRYDRFVIPVKAESRGSYKGLVHDTSNSGSTLFVEPLFVIEANNNIQRLENEEKREIERILSELTEEVAVYAPVLTVAYRSLLTLDYIFAKARYSYEYDMCEPYIAEKKLVEIKHARHPLISKDIMVPLDISMDSDTDTIIVTGPNTGGKTVFLKTLGLMALMTKAGMHLPCDSAKVFVFDRVYADIGDEQSIEQSLSTFSSHLKNNKNIISAADSKSLVLFDELGSGTDPSEGAALAIAIIEKVRSNGSFVACTTHYSELKTFALEQAGIKNASFEFDLETLSPTYRLNVGIPGKSYAFEISKHLGLQDDVIANAKSHISQEVKRFDRVVDELLREKGEYERLKRELAEQKAEAGRARLNLKKRNSKLEKNAERELENARMKARQVIEKARRDANNMLEELKKQRSEMDKQSFQRIRSAVRSSINKLDAGDIPLEAKPQDGKPLGKRAAVGMTVFVPKLSKSGEIVSISGDNARVNCGGLSISCKINELYTRESTADKKPDKPKPQGTAKLVRSERQDTGMELDIRGETVMDALDAIDRFIDRAVLDRMGSVTIIHGKGTGALRAGVHSHLKGHRQVKGFHLGAYGEGDSGVTVVELK